jgi:type I restriction enzyme S subunit
VLGGGFAMKYSAYPAYKDSGVEWLGEIPEHWEVKRLKYVCSLLRDGTHQPPARVTDGIPLLSVRNIVDGQFINLDDDSLISEKDFKELERSFKVKKDDVLLAIVGATLGKVAVVGKMPPFAIQRSLAVMRPRLEILNFKFLYFFLVSSEFQKLLWKNVGFSAQPGIYLGALGNFHITLPDIKEQLAIASFLDRETAKIDALIAKKERLIELLQEKRTAIISHAVTKGLDPSVPLKDSGVEWLGEIPRHWNIIKLGRLCNVTKLTGFEYTKFWKTDLEGDIIALRGLNIKNNRLILDDIERISSDLSNQLFRSKLFAGDIVFPCTGTIGNGALIEEDNKFHINQNIAKITPGAKLNSNFILYVLISQNMRYQISLLNASDFQPVLLIGTIRDIRLQIPPKIEQDSIADWLDRKTSQIDALINKTHTSIEQLKEYRTALISAAVTGKIDVRNEVAS